MTNNITIKEKDKLEVFMTPQTSLKPPKHTSFRSPLGVKGEHLRPLTSPKNEKELIALKTRAVKQKKEIDALTMKVERIDLDRMKFAKALIAAKYVDKKDRAELVSCRDKLEEEQTKVKELSYKLEEERMKVENEKTKMAELSTRHKLETKKAISLKNDMVHQKEKIVVLENKVVEVKNGNSRLGKELKTSITTQEKQRIQFDASKVVALEEKRKLEGKVTEMEKLSLKEKWEMRKFQRENRKLTKLSANHKSFLNKLRGKIQCPVCQEVPRAETVPVCSNGHFVCRKCKTNSCPTCRVAMGNCMSSLAMTVIENIDHKCKFAACQEFFALKTLEQHEQFCSHRTVKCPYLLCNAKIALSNLLGHVVSKKCCKDGSPSKVSWDSISYTRRNFQLTDESNSTMYWTYSLFSLDGMFFVVFPVKLEGVFYFSLVMFSSEAVCSKYKIEMIVHEKLSAEIQDSEVSYKYSGKPSSIDTDYNLSKHQGLTVDGKSMEQILKKGDTCFSVSFSIQKK